jgi:hypothetical protein
VTGAELKRPMIAAERKRALSRESSRRYRARKGLMRVHLYVDPGWLGDLLRFEGYIGKLDEDCPDKFACGIEKMLRDYWVTRHAGNLEDMAE